MEGLSEDQGKLVFLEEQNLLVPQEEVSHFFGSKLVKELSEKDFTSSGSLKEKKCSFVVLYAAWCGHCRKLAPEWSKFAETAAFVEVFAINSGENEKLLKLLNKKTPGLVSGYPTIVIYKNGEIAEVYEGERNSSALLKKAMQICKR